MHFYFIRAYHVQFDSCSCDTQHCEVEVKKIVIKEIDLQHLISQNSSPFILIENYSLFLSRLVDDDCCDALMSLLILIKNIKVSYHNVDEILRLFDHVSLLF